MENHRDMGCYPWAVQRAVEGENCGARRGRWPWVVVGRMKPPSPTAGAGVVACKQLNGKGRQLGGRAGRHALRLASTTLHSMSQARHQGDSNSGREARLSSSVDRARANQRDFETKARGPRKEPVDRLRQLCQKNREKLRRHEG